MEKGGDLFLGVEFDSDSEEPINFLENRLMDLSPFSAHEVEIDGEVFKTAEHAYQALRTKVGPEREDIKNAKCPLDAWRLGQECKNSGLLIESLDKDQLMEKIFRAKLLQNDDIKHVLEVTKNRDLVKVFPSDPYWGTGENGDGENRMGKLWMKLRKELV